MELADLVASWSKDPRVKVGAVITDRQNVIRGIGFNGFPRGVFDVSERLENAQTTRLYVVHAERNAILNSHGDLRGCTLYCNVFPCNDCTKEIIQAGITKVVVPHIAPDSPSRNYAVSIQMMKEAGVAYELLEETA